MGGGNLAPALVGEKRPGIEVVLGEEQLTPTSPRYARLGQESFWQCVFHFVSTKKYLKQ